MSLENDHHSGSNLATASLPSLQQFSLACLALHLSDLIPMGPSLFPYMQTPHKKSLMAVARRQGLLKPCFSLLYDPDYTILDVHLDNDDADDDRLELSELLHALEISSQNLRMIDIRGYALTPRIIHIIADCTRLEVLRIGGSGTTTYSTRDSVAAAVKKLLPDKHHMPVLECWDDDNNNDSSIKGNGRLWQLRCLLWDEMPSSLETFVTLSCPGVCVNPSKHDTCIRGCLEYDVEYDLDMPYIEEVAGGDARWGRGMGMGGGQQPEKEELHIAEKFKRAWDERLAKLVKLEEKRMKKERVARRKELEKSPSAMMITRWELEEI